MANTQRIEDALRVETRKALTQHRPVGTDSNRAASSVFFRTKVERNYVLYLLEYVFTGFVEWSWDFARIVVRRLWAEIIDFEDSAADREEILEVADEWIGSDPEISLKSSSGAPELR